MKKLILIDGNAILHRAFHALPPLTNKDGIPTNAVYGFFMMLFKIIEDLKPEYLIVAFDRAKPTFRKEMYVGYQAKRPKMSDDLVPQVDIVYKALDSAKISHFGIDGYEADDLIGTLSKQGAEKDLEVIIVSGDRDLLQLVNKHVLLLAPVVGITKMILFDETKVKEKYGITPAQFIDYKAIVGDNSDNYPGVTGIGPKGAADLLNKFGNLENLYAHISKLPLPLQEKLANDAEQCAMAKKLATIILDAPLTLNENEANISKMDKKTLRKFFEKLNFNSLIGRLDKMSKAKEKADLPKPEREEKKPDDQMSLL